MNRQASMTLLESLVAAIRDAAAYDSTEQASPAAVLWPDEERAWLEVMPALRAAMPELISWGAYDAPTRTGPAIWIKTMLGVGSHGASLLPVASWSQGIVPVIYMPGVGRQVIRVLEECPAELKPLCELQFRGTTWSQLNGKDWTPRAFLQSAEGGLGLSLATDAATLGAMRQALTTLAGVPVSSLRGRVLEASDFHDLLAPDPVRTVLEWMGDPAAFKTRIGSGWSAFRALVKERFGFDPDKSDATKAGRMLAEREGAWKSVWQRYSENPRLHPGVREVLRRSKPGNADLLFGAGPSPYPQDNDIAEQELREALVKVATLHEAAARDRLAELEAAHAARRSSVWADLGEAPLAQAMEHLARLALLSKHALGGGSPREAAEQYAATGWKVDDAAMASLAAVRTAADMEAVGGAVRAVYQPWLEKTAGSFQSLVNASPLPAATDAPVDAAEPGVVTLFADGLRMDLARRLEAELVRRGMGVALGWRWSTIPSVTATAKPAASPVAGLLDAASESDEFVPRIREGGKALTSERFRSLLRSLKVEPLSGGERGDPSGSAWLEAGSIDRRGHAEGVRLASMLEEEVRLLADRVADLLAAGWGRVRVVTDHGWLLLPGGLPKVEMPKYLVETNWRRCASMKAGSQAECKVHGWHWNPAVSIAVAPGIRCFREGADYAHGGVSLQESVVAVLTVTGEAGGTGGGNVTIASLRWNHLTCRVEVRGAGGVSVDLRQDGTDASTTLLESEAARPLDATGQAKLYAKDDVQEGMEAEVVVLDADGRVLTRRRTRIGRE